MEILIVTNNNNDKAGVMQLDFSQKVSIIDHLSLPDNWSNIFNMKFFTDETRKWSRKDVGGLTVMTSADNKQCKVIDEENGRSLLIEQRSGNRTKVTDEHDRSFVLNQGKIKSRGDTVSNVVPIQSTTEFGFDDETAKTYVLGNIAIILRFNTDGSKTVFFDDIGHRVEMSAHAQGVKQESHPGNFFHKISFDNSTFKEWEIAPAYAMMFAKLVIAKDLNIEPNLNAFNKLDENKATALLLNYLKEEYDEDWDGSESWLPLKEKAHIGIADAEKPWNDTTEFAGYHADLPNNFFIQKTNDGYDLTTSSDFKHSILTQGELLRQARSKDILAIQNINEQTATQSVLHMLNHGHTTTDHLGQDWRFVVLQSAASQKVVTSMNDVAHKALGIDSHDYAAINFSDSHSLIAIEAETLERASIAYNASHQVMAMVKNNDRDQGKLEELIEMGADYRYVDPEGASKGKTFSDHMKYAESYELLSMLRDVQGVHPDMPEMDDDSLSL